MTIISVENVLFYSEGDEQNFFRFLESNPCVKQVTGEGRKINIEVKDDCLDIESFLSLYAAIKRYEGECRQLRNLITYMNKEDADYLKSTKMIWHCHIFRQ